MERRTLLKALLGGGGLAIFAAHTNALKFFPRPSRQRWAILFGSRYGSTRDASLWISEGMGDIANVFDARENPDLSNYDHLIVGSGIYSGDIDRHLAAYLSRHAPVMGKRINALFVVSGSGNSPRAMAYVEALVHACRARPAAVRTFPGRITRRLLSPADDQIEEAVFRRRNAPFADYDHLKREDCLRFGAEILRKA